MQRFIRRTIHGVIAGVMGAGCMTVFRLAMRRAGLIEQMVPQTVETWLRDHPKQPLPLPSDPAGRHLVDQLLHLGYGSAGGATYGALTRAGTSLGASTALFTVATWAFGSIVLLPGLGIARPPWHARLRENAVNIAAHALYCSVVALVTDEPERQGRSQPRTRRQSLGAAFG